jgi:hypothetical protein
VTQGPNNRMRNASADPAAPPAPARVGGGIVLLGTALGAVLTPVVVWCAMLVYDHFDPMCDGGGAEGSLSCVLRALAVTVISVVPGLLIGVVGGRYFASRRAR